MIVVCGHVVWQANELWPNEVNPGTCLCAEVYIIMDHRAGETYF